MISNISTNAYIEWNCSGGTHFGTLCRMPVQGGNIGADWEHLQRLREDLDKSRPSNIGAQLLAALQRSVREADTVVRTMGMPVDPGILLPLERIAGVSEQPEGMRCHAVYLIGTSPRQEVPWLLVGILAGLTNDDPGAPILARRIGTLLSKKAVLELLPTLLGIVLDPSQSTPSRVGACNALSTYSKMGDQLIGQLVDLLMGLPAHDAEFNEFARSLGETLGGLGASSHADSMLNILNDPAAGTNLRLGAFRTLASLGGHEDQFIELLRADFHKQGYDPVLGGEILGYFEGRPHPDLATMLFGIASAEGGNPDIRSRAVELMESYVDDGVDVILMTLLDKTTVPEVRAQLFRSLGTIQSEEGLERARDLIDTFDSTPPEELDLACLALEGAAMEADIDRLKPLLDLPPGICPNAYRAMAAIGTTGAIDGLSATLEKGRWQEAIPALEGVRGDAPAYVLIEFLETNPPDDAKVRTAKAIALTAGADSLAYIETYLDNHPNEMEVARSLLDLLRRFGRDDLVEKYVGDMDDQHVARLERQDTRQQASWMAMGVGLVLLFVIPVGVGAWLGWAYGFNASFFHQAADGLTQSTEGSVNFQNKGEGELPAGRYRAVTTVAHRLRSIEGEVLVSIEIHSPGNEKPIASLWETVPISFEGGISTSIPVGHLRLSSPGKYTVRWVVEEPSERKGLFSLVNVETVSLDLERVKWGLASRLWRIIGLFCLPLLILLIWAAIGLVRLPPDNWGDIARRASRHASIGAGAGTFVIIILLFFEA